jgi:N-acetylneuraminic acid mutarotase
MAVGNRNNLADGTSSTRRAEPTLGANVTKIDSRTISIRRRRLARLAIALALVIGGCASPTRTASPTPSRATADCVSGSIGWRVVGALGQSRALHEATVLADGRVLITGGDDGSHFLDTAELFDPLSAQWSPTGSMGTRRSGPAGVLLRDGRVLVAGGNGPGSSSTELFDPPSGTWTTVERMIHGRTGHSATPLADGTVLIVGGIGGIGAAASSAHTQPAEVYDPAGGTWTATGPMAFNRVGHTATLLSDGRVLVAGGTSQSGGQPRSSSEIYDPKDKTWTPNGDLPAERTNHTAVKLRDGSVIVAGGTGLGGSSMTSVDRLDPATGQWAAAGELEIGFTFGRSALLCDGTVLFAGGQSDGEDRAQIYDPRNGLVTASATLVARHAFGTLTVLQDGRALLAGGYGPDGTAVGVAELFGPLP